jgi:phage-related protein
MLAALSRGGEAFLKGVFPYFKKGFTGITGLLDKIAPLAEKLGQTFGRWVEGTVIPALQNLGTWITTTVVPALKELGAWIVSNRATLEELGAKLTEIGQTVLAAFIATLQAAYAALQTTAQWIKNNHDWLVPLVTVIASAVAGYNAYIKVMAIWKAAVVAAKAAQVALNAAMALNPIGLVIAAVAALTAGLVWFFTKTETGKRTWDRIWSGIKSTFQGAMRAIQPVLKELKAYWDVMWPRMKALWDAVGPPLINYIKRLFSVMGSSVGTVFKNMGVVIKTIWNQIKNVIKTALGVIQGIIKTVTSIMKGDWKGAWDGIKQIVTSMTDGIRNTFKNLASGMGEIGKNIIRGLVGGLKSLASAPGEALSAIGSGIKNKFKSILGIHSPSKVFEGFGANIVQGLVSGLDKNRERAGVAITKIANKITDAKHLQGKSALVEYVRAQGRDLDALWKSHDATVKKLAKAKDELKALLDARRSMRDQIASSLSGAVNLGSVVAKDEDGNIAKGKTTKKDVASYVSGLAKKAKTFAARMKDLVAKGWPDSLVQHVAGLGWDEGIEVANALLAKGKGSTAANAAIKADWASIEKSSLSVGKTVSNSMFSVGVDAAQGLVDGLKASAKKTEKAAKDLAKTLAKWVKKELGIASPSKLFRRFGRFTTEGLAIGLTDEASRVTKSMKKVTGLVTDGYNPSLSPTLPNGAQPHTAGSVTYEITVNALTATEEVGRKVVESIKKFERAGGRV